MAGAKRTRFSADGSPKRFAPTRRGSFRVSRAFPVLRGVPEVMRRPMSRAARCKGRRNELTAADSNRDEVTCPRFDSKAEDRRDCCPRGQTVRSSVLPMRGTKEQFIDRTLEVWQPRTSKVLTGEDARQIAENVTEFFQILTEWEAAEQRTTGQIAEAETDIAHHPARKCPQ